MRCEICGESDDLSSPDGLIEERLLINYHPTVLCTQCTRVLSNKLCRTPEFAAYQACVDMVESNRINKSLKAADAMTVNSKYCESLAQSGHVMCILIQELARQAGNH